MFEQSALQPVTQEKARPCLLSFARLYVFIVEGLRHANTELSDNKGTGESWALFFKHSKQLLAHY